MNKCICCEELKPLDEFYKHPGMETGHLNKCKSCCKQYAKAQLDEKCKDPEWVEKEHQRQLEKNRRPYRKSKKPMREPLPRLFDKTWKNHFYRYPEKQKARSISAKMQCRNPGHEHHHWSYREENAKSLLEISKKDHYVAHINLIYLQAEFCYTTLVGLLLDTIQKHIEYLDSINIKASIVKPAERHNTTTK